MECAVFRELKKIRETVEEDRRFKKGQLSAGEVVEYVGTLAQPFYRRLWLTSTRRERLLLYHLAHGSLVNPMNERLVNWLIRRGLIRRDPALRIANESFRKFILSAESPAAFVELKQFYEDEEGDVWSTVRIPLLTVIVLIAVFIFISSQDTLDYTLALLGGAAASLPILLRVGALFGFGGGRS